MSPHFDRHANPRALLTPATLKVVDSIARAGHVPMHALSATQAKAAYAAAANVLELPVQKLARVEDFSIPARDGYAIPARHYAPDHTALRMRTAGMPCNGLLTMVPSAG